MRKKEVGQALILVLILLAIGALSLVPALRLTGTSLKSSQIVTQQTKAMYVVDAVQEYVMWKLLYDNFGAEFTYDGDTKTVPFNVCGIQAEATVIMRAVESVGPVVFATEHVIRPTKTVFPDTVLNDSDNIHTYTIKLEQLSSNTTQGLDAIYDVLPKGFDPSDYIADSGYLRVDGGPWQSIPDPLIEVEANQCRLLWPADYKWETGTGAFSSDPLDVDRYFYGVRDFAVRQVKELKYEVSGQLGKNENHPSWLLLKPWNTLSGRTGIITVGSPDPPDVSEDGMMVAYVTPNPDIIQPGVETDIEYTIHITNLDKETLAVMEIKDWLPPGFTYTANSTSGITSYNPQLSLENLNDVERWLLYWPLYELPGGTVSVASGETVTLTFWVVTTKDMSGTYFSEVMCIPNSPVPSIMGKVGVTLEEYVTNYSWNTGTVIVPAYDSQVESGGITSYANFGLTLGGITIKSWQVK